MIEIIGLMTGYKYENKLCINLIEVWDDDFLRDKEGILQHIRDKIKILSELTYHI